MVQGQRILNRGAFTDDGMARGGHAYRLFGALLVDVSTRGGAACHAIICEGASVEDALAIYQG